MKNRKITAITLILLFTLGNPLFMLVQAEETRQTDIDWRSHIGETYNLEKNTINAANYTPDADFKTVLSSNGYESAGIYYGPRFPSYQILYRQYSREARVNITVNLTCQEIQIGSAGYWIRIPVDADDIDTIEINGYNLGSISDMTKNIIIDDTGLYIYWTEPLIPYTPKQFSFNITPLVNHDLLWHISNEEYNEEENTITWITQHTKQVGEVQEIYTDYYRKEIIPCTPAFMFLFQRGLDRNGYSSQWIAADEVIYISGVIGYDNNWTYPSVYMPFRSIEAVDFDIYWDVVRDSPTWSSTLWNELGDSLSWGIAGNSISDKDMLLASCPYRVNATGYTGIGAVNHSSYLYCRIKPDKPILLIQRSDNDGAVHRAFDYSTATAFSNGENTGAAITSYYGLMEFNSDQWSRTYKYNGYSWVDYGWAGGYVFPGETTIHVFMDTGASVWFNGTSSEVWDLLLKPQYTLDQAVNDAVKGSVSWLMDEYLPNTLGKGTQFIGDFLNNLINFSKMVWRIIEGLMDYFISIANLLIIALPLIMLQFSSDVIYHKETRNKKRIKKEA
jgi:hypothetical protein